jgi:membrane protein DedA with SNARE-associated domain
MSVLQHLALSSPLSYLAAFLIPMLDAILPVLPSETIVIALGVSTAGSTDPRIALLVGLAACGAFAGDNLCYFIGRRFGPLAERKLFAGEKGARRRAWATGALDRFGARLIVVCRFIPGGRTAVTLTCGIVGYSRRSFLIATAFAGVIWACYAFFLGRLGGKAFEDRPWVGLLLALGLTVVISVLIEAARRAWVWRRSRQQRARTPGHTGAEEHPRAPVHPTAALGLTEQRDGR